LRIDHHTLSAKGVYASAKSGTERGIHRDCRRQHRGPGALPAHRRAPRPKYDRAYCRAIPEGVRLLDLDASHIDESQFSLCSFDEDSDGFIAELDQLSINLLARPRLDNAHLGKIAAAGLRVCFGHLVLTPREMRAAVIAGGHRPGKPAHGRVRLGRSDDKRGDKRGSVGHELPIRDASER
jgi:hypothetical protein